MIYRLPPVIPEIVRTACHRARRGLRTVSHWCFPETVGPKTRSPIFLVVARIRSRCRIRGSSGTRNAEVIEDCSSLPVTVVWLHMQDSPPPTKRIKLESPPPELSHSNDDLFVGMEGEEDVDNQCSICLQPLTDRTLIPRCSHEFCFECLVIWAGMSAWRLCIIFLRPLRIVT